MNQVAYYYTEVSHLERGLANYSISFFINNNKYQELQRDFEKSLTEIKNLWKQYSKAIKKMRSLKISSEL